MSIEYKKFLVSKFGGQQVFVETLPGVSFRGQLIGVDEHVNLLL